MVGTTFNLGEKTCRKGNNYTVKHLIQHVMLISIIYESSGRTRQQHTTYVIQSTDWTINIHPKKKLKPTTHILFLAKIVS